LGRALFLILGYERLLLFYCLEFFVSFSCFFSSCVVFAIFVFQIHISEKQLVFTLGFGLPICI
ncbi:MAG: hypothetical protein ACD_39C02076G0001, partial [uncultured bacterium]